MAPSHYFLSRCWFPISEVLWHSPESNFTVSVLYNASEIYTFKITTTSPRGYCVKLWVDETSDSCYNKIYRYIMIQHEPQLWQWHYELQAIPSTEVWTMWIHYTPPTNLDGGTYTENRSRPKRSVFDQNTLISHCHKLHIVQVLNENTCIIKAYQVTEKSQITRFMGPTWGLPGSCRPQMGPMLALWSLLSQKFLWSSTLSDLAGPVLATHLGRSLGSLMETQWSSVSTYQGITVQLSYLQYISIGDIAELNGNTLIICLHIIKGLLYNCPVSSTYWNRPMTKHNTYLIVMDCLWWEFWIKWLHSNGTRLWHSRQFPLIHNPAQTLAGPALATNLRSSSGSLMETHWSSVSTYQGITVQLSYL